MSAQPLGCLKPGQHGRVLSIKGQRALRRRIMDMGIVRGTQISVEKVAPLGDPIEFKVRDYNLSLRQIDANNIIVCCE